MAERGQVTVILALMGVLLVGAGALALDFSYQAVGHRNLQNWADTAAIAGARDCATGCNATTEVTDALQMVLQNSPWSSTTSWLTSAPTSACTTTSCVVTNYAGPGGSSNFQVSASSPPSNPDNAGYNTTNYVEVDISQSNPTSLAGVIGVTSTTSAGHAVAYSSGPPGPYQYTFFSKKQTDSGNQVETIVGDAFVGDGYSPGSGGKAALCILEIPGPEPASDTDADAAGGQDNDLDDQGHVVFGVAPPTVGQLPTYGTTCAGKGGGQLAVQQVAPSSGANCPVNSTPTQDVASGKWLCVQANPSVPNIPAPSPTQVALGCGATVNPATAPGVYAVSPGCAVTVDFSAGNINCVSLVPGAGSSVSVKDKKGQQYMTSYGFDPTTDPTAKSAITAIGQPAPAAKCGGWATPANKTVIWAADPGPSATMPTVLSNSSTGCCSDSLLVGTLFVPNQVVNFNADQAIEDVGSVYVGDWQVQSGNHPNPTVTYDAAAGAPVAPSLRLVE